MALLISHAKLFLHLATHPRLYRPNDTSTLKEHMPLNHQYQHEKMNPQRLKNWATSVGANAKIFVQQRLETTEYPTNAYRGIIAILSLEKMYGVIIRKYTSLKGQL